MPSIKRPRPSAALADSALHTKTHDESESLETVVKRIFPQQNQNVPQKARPSPREPGTPWKPTEENFIRIRSEELSGHSHNDLLLRQSNEYVFFALPTSYKGLTTGPAPGEVVGITLGATLGFFIAFYLIFVVMANSAAAVAAGDEEVIVERHHHHRSQGARTARTRRTRRRSESSRSSQPPIVRPPIPTPRPPAPRTERIIVEERTTRERSRPPPPSSINERTTILQEERVEDDDVVEVIEEHSVSDASPRPRRKSGYRTIDPLAYGGGDFPLRSVSRRRSQSRGR